MKVILLLAVVLAAAGCDSARAKRYTVTTPDGRVFKEMRWSVGGDNWTGWSGPGDQWVLIQGPHVAVQEIEAEAKSE